MTNAYRSLGERGPSGAELCKSTSFINLIARASSWHGYKVSTTTIDHLYNLMADTTHEKMPNTAELQPRGFLYILSMLRSSACAARLCSKFWQSPGMRGVWGRSILGDAAASFHQGLPNARLSRSHAYAPWCWNIDQHLPSNHPNVGKYTRHGAYETCKPRNCNSSSSGPALG